MAHLANCPKCDHEFFVPDSVSEGTWGRCPSCRAFFQLSDAQTRELAALEVVGSDAVPPTEMSNEQHAPAEMATIDTWSSDSSDDDLALHDEDMGRPAIKETAATIDFSEPQDNNELNFDDLKAMFDEPHESAPPAKPSAEFVNDDDLEIAMDEPATAHLSAPADEPLNFADDDEPNDELNLDDMDEPSFDLDSIEEKASTAAPVEGVETPEAAAQRIDAWFRSAKTVADVPPMESMEIDYQPETPKSTPAINSTVDLGASGIDAFNTSDDFELDSTADEKHGAAAWDDAQHMDRLIADFKDADPDEFVPSMAAKETAYADDDFEPEMTAEPTESAPAAAEWTPEQVVASIVPPRKKRSLARLAVAAVVGGAVGIVLANYAWIWMRGPEGDLLGIAKYLPKATLPSSFNPPPKQTATAPPFAPQQEETPAEPAEPAPVADDAAKTAAEMPKPADDTAEKQASFTEPAAATPAPPQDDRYGLTTTTADKPAEPAPVDTTSAAPIKQATPPSEPIKIKDAPTFAAADLSAALQAGKDAEPGLVNGNFADSLEVKRAKGFSYMILADLAQKAMFVEPATADTAKLQQETEELFQKLMADPHTRDEVSQVAPKWISSPSRKQSGIFFAGNVIGSEAKGTFSECSIDLGNGQTMPVIVPAAVAESIKASRTPLGVVGYIVDQPATNLPGYTGNTPQAIFATKLLPLQESK